jgi:hypothetical protein
MTDEVEAQPSDFASLAAKIRSLDLDKNEAAALASLLRRARDAGAADVEGFGADIASLGFDTRLPSGSTFKGTDEELQFKGSDEELQALLDWSTGRRSR